MKSIKRGRGPSMMGGFGALFVSVFGVFWTIAAASMGAPWFFPLFGVCFVIYGIAIAVYNFKNATGKQRYSEYDIVDGNEEPDPLHQRYGASLNDSFFEQNEGNGTSAAFCPYCGAKAQSGFDFCPKCGKKLPD